MKIWLVPSHLSIGPQGGSGIKIEFHKEMLARGVWKPGTRTTNQHYETNGENTGFQRWSNFERSRQESSITGALKALDTIGGTHSMSPHAVISLLWCPLEERLMCAPRVALALYAGNRLVLSLPQQGETQVTVFPLAVKPIPRNAEDWRQVFEKALNLQSA